MKFCYDFNGLSTPREADTIRTEYVCHFMREFVRQTREQSSELPLIFDSNYSRKIGIIEGVANFTFGAAFEYYEKFNRDVHIVHLRIDPETKVNRPPIEYHTCVRPSEPGYYLINSQFIHDFVVQTETAVPSTKYTMAGINFNNIKDLLMFRGVCLGALSICVEDLVDEVPEQNIENFLIREQAQIAKKYFPEYSIQYQDLLSRQDLM